MKKFLKLAAVACAAVLFVSCGAKKDDATQIKEVMESYIAASASFDFGKLRSIVTPESKPALEEMERMTNGLPEEYRNAATEAAKAANFNAESVKIDGETATASIVVGGMEIPMALRKVDGKWLLDMVGSVPAVDDVDIDELEIDVEEPADGEQTDAPAENDENGTVE